MSITQQEADSLELAFMESMPQDRDYSKESALKLLDVWNQLVRIMARENNMSDQLGVESIDWQIGNWANDTTMAAHNAHLYEEEIKVNEQILQIYWHNSNDNFHENAKRDIADAYADMGRMEKCLQLYDCYLKEDPLWGWAWIGYYRQLQHVDEKKFEAVLDELYRKVKDGVDFRDKEDLYRELGDEYNTLGNQERADYFYTLEDEEKDRRRNPNKEIMSKLPVLKPKKIYPNDPCPCGSGKKYKKCCGRR